MRARVYMTAKDTALALTEVAKVRPLPRNYARSEHTPYVFVDRQKKFQSIVGFGGAVSDASAEVFAALPESAKQAFLEAYYDVEKGIGYSLARTNINSCDFSSDSYTYCEEGDKDLRTFSIAHDQRYKIPLIKKAMTATGGKITLFASPWSPPKWMKDNGNMLQGGKLLPEFRDAWARYYVKFIEAYAREGIPVWGITVQNEPEARQWWESCIYTPEEERNFIRDHLGPTLQKSGYGCVKVIAWDHNRNLMYERARVILSDPEAAKYVWGIGYHWYEDWNGSGNCYDNVALVHEAFPEKHLLFTEGCHSFTDGMYEWINAEKYGMAIINDMNRGCEGWCDWNILLDERGGPNHVGNFCLAPVHAKDGELIFTGSYYYLGHFSKFVRPGYQRVACSSGTGRLLTTGFASPDNKRLVVVVQNIRDEEYDTHIAFDDGEIGVRMLPHSIASIVVEYT